MQKYKKYIFWEALQITDNLSFKYLIEFKHI